MKNIHVLPTDKLSRLHEYDCLSPIGLSKEPLQWRLGRNIYITSDEEIKEGNWYLDTNDYIISKAFFIPLPDNCKKIILTDNKYLVQDGVQAIDDEFLEWFVAHPSCEKVEVENNWIDWIIPMYKIIIPKEELNIYTQDDYFNDEFPKEEPRQIDEKGNPLTFWGGLAEPKQETLEEVAENYSERHQDVSENLGKYLISAVFIDGAEWQKERSYSEEDVMAILYRFHYDLVNSNIDTKEEWFEQFKKK